MNRKFNWRVIVVLGAILCLPFMASNVSAQTNAASETDVAQSMGVGLKSRFASGAKPIELSRTSIVPGTPMTVNSTMSNIMSSNSGGSFGGILSRYDTENFGKFFGDGTLNSSRLTSSRVDALEDLDSGDNEVENVDTARMYPARLALDFKIFPRRRVDSKETTEILNWQIENVVSRFNFDQAVEEIHVESKGNVLFLRGRVKSPRMAKLLQSVLGMQTGVDRVVNELEVMGDAQNVDLFGNPVEE